MTVREQALSALMPIITAAAASIADMDELVTRNESSDRQVGGTKFAWLNLTDGSTDDSTWVSDGWDFTQTARLAVIVGGESDADCDTRFDALIAAVAAAVAADDTLGGLVDLAQVRAPEEPDPEMLAEAIGFKVGVLPILLLYTAPTAAG